MSIPPLYRRSIISIRFEQHETHKSPSYFMLFHPHQISRLTHSHKTDSESENKYILCKNKEIVQFSLSF